MMVTFSGPAVPIGMTTSPVANGDRLKLPPDPACPGSAAQIPSNPGDASCVSCSQSGTSIAIGHPRDVRLHAHVDGALDRTRHNVQKQPAVERERTRDKRLRVT